jgi:hypothetical protein
VIADFLIGAHATTAADRLLSRDRGFYRRYFKGLTLLDPSQKEASFDKPLTERLGGRCPRSPKFRHPDRGRGGGRGGGRARDARSARRTLEGFG